MLLTIKQVAERLQLSSATVRELIRSGRLRAIRTLGDRGSFRISEAALAEYLSQQEEARNEQR